jgi:hypothetical protein
MSHLHYVYRSPNTEATLPDVFFDNQPFTILVGLGGSMFGVVLAAAAPGSFDAHLTLVLNTIWFVGWTLAGLYRGYKWATDKPKYKPFTPLSDDDTPVWKGK